MGREKARKRAKAACGDRVCEFVEKEFGGFVPPPNYD
jgi:hypothetical protein